MPLKPLKFGTEIFRGYDLTGVKFSVSLLILAWALEQLNSVVLLHCL